MNMTKKHTFAILLILAIASLALAACGGQPDPANDATTQETQISAIYTQAAETLQAEIALTEAARPQATNTPASSPTPVFIATNTPVEPAESPTPFPTLPSLPTPTQIPTKPPATGGRPCLRAEIAFESPKDGAKLSPSQSFVKQWNLTNSGSCEWKDNFSLVHMGGPNFTDFGSFNLVDISNLEEGKTIPNGGMLVIMLSMESPATPGSHRSIWMLRDDNGQVFGVGVLGDEIFWVDILVRSE
jgi:hypothetical protein